MAKTNIIFWNGNLKKKTVKTMNTAEKDVLKFQLL